MIYHPDHHYENVHHVESVDSWHREIEAKRSTVKLHHNVYNDFHQLTVIQTPQVTSNETPRWPKQRQPSFTESPQDSLSQNSTDFDSSQSSDEAVKWQNERNPSFTDSPQDLSSRIDFTSADAPAVCGEPQYMNMRRSGRRSPVEDDERFPRRIRGKHHYVNDLHDCATSAIRHPSPPPPPLPERQTSIKQKNTPRRPSMKDRPLPEIPDQGGARAGPEKESKVTKVHRTKPSNDYTEPPHRRQGYERMPSRPVPLLPPLKGERLMQSQW